MEIKRDAEQRHQHDKAHALWRRFTTFLMPDEQMRGAGDAELQVLLKRIRQGVQDQTDLDFLHSRCYQEGRRIPWETGITAVTPLNRNRWNLNVEGVLADGGGSRHDPEPVRRQRDPDARNLHVRARDAGRREPQHASRVEASERCQYKAVEVILDKTYPGHRISADMMIHFGPPAWLILASETMEGLHFVGMPPRHDRADTDDYRDSMPTKAAVAAERCQLKGTTMCGGLRVHRLQGVGGTLARVVLELRGTRRRPGLRS
ncbi:hypothetical protein PT974_02983 [Cladobotryum mycophilum]|uniref:Uncharacterized protein n=1 Tax=Cladobotryum mycophilum TaxID=491253 RepID=A0ABR0SZK8_9HYPO